MSQEPNPRQVPVRRVRVVQPVGNAPQQDIELQERSNLSAYIAGGVVSALLTALLVLIWLLVTPNNPFTGNQGRGVSVPAPNGQVIPGAVPTEVQPVGTGAPNQVITGVPAIPPAVSTASPAPAGNMPVMYTSSVSNSPDLRLILNPLTLKICSVDYITGAITFLEANRE